MEIIKRVLFRHCAAGIAQKKMITSNVLMAAIAEVNGNHCEGGNVISQHTSEDGVVRMKIRVRKEDLEQVLELMKMNGGGGNISNNIQRSNRRSSLSVEQRLSLLRKKRANLAKHKRQTSWSPALQSIPEEISAC